VASRACRHGRRVVNAVHLYDALYCASTASLAAEAGETAKAETAWLEASVAAAGAFAAGSREAEALGTVLAAVARVTEAVA
jgi:hypothetical protein